MRIGGGLKPVLALGKKRLDFGWWIGNDIYVSNKP
jgi:hypothetical protein